LRQRHRYQARALVEAPAFGLGALCAVTMGGSPSAKVNMQDGSVLHTDPGAPLTLERASQSGIW
jgi:hypothetical protein